MKKFLTGIVFLIVTQQLVAQSFSKDIQNFRRQDSIAMPAKDPILFIGSSSFTLWKSVKEDFPGYPILNRAFGGSTLSDLIYYVKDIVYPYQPRQIVIYCGENDFAANDSLYPSQVAKRFELLFVIIRKKFPKVPVVYVSMKPSPARVKLMAKFNVANVMIRSFLKDKKNTAFVDVYHAMLNADGSVNESIFLADKLHMNKKGYAIWQPLIQNKLKK
ncbi:MAG: G-D-S-L family lipolytic protein [Bacteroidetes bacterium]|jgi:lysophospholipase L1-like esterase|nr:G-D-S-L family lipolytic protein [Bacteroidota bacterium]MBS1925947.1 G-D-S-L family lipolytic protein [Bacteroidota bacterium]MCC6692903.1 G-D-S-L family lipolytic protein [Chitinophagaceae bacterium]HMU23891.1 GDSL-type esterase/lipase family protein [Ferruginibacter sp.]HRD42156.1 GDSL-type esterase/lipase family protein [Ferruginibacter sp.]